MDADDNDDDTDATVDAAVGTDAAATIDAVSRLTSFHNSRTQK